MRLLFHANCCSYLALTPAPRIKLSRATQRLTAHLWRLHKYFASGRTLAFIINAPNDPLVELDIKHLGMANHKALSVNFIEQALTEGVSLLLLQI